MHSGVYAFGEPAQQTVDISSAFYITTFAGTDEEDQ